MAYILLVFISVQLACMVITYSKSMDQPGKVANPARGQLNRKNEYSPVLVWHATNDKTGLSTARIRPIHHPPSTTGRIST